MFCHNKPLFRARSKGLGRLVHSVYKLFNVVIMVQLHTHGALSKHGQDATFGIEKFVAATILFILQKRRLDVDILASVEK